MTVARRRRGHLDERRPRRRYLDWMRGLAVLVMIEAHLLDSWTRFPDRQTREFGRAMILGGLGGALAIAAWAASYLPSPYPQTYFWTTSPAFFFLRVGLMTAAVGLAYLWESRPGGLDKWSPMQQLGRSSLFIYWIHVEMVYGLISLPWHKGLSWGQAWIALAIFSMFMLLCSIGKDRVVDWWTRRSLGAHGDHRVHGRSAPGG